MEMPYNIVNSSLYLSLFCCFICTLIIMFKVLSRTRGNKYNLPPSPPKFPIIGNLHQLGTLPHRSLRALSHKYGPLMFLQLGQTPILVVSSADIVKEIVKSYDILFSDRPQNIATKILFYGCKDIAFLPHGDEWRQKRKVSVHELLSHQRVQSYWFVREDEVSGLMKKIHEACERGCSVNLTHMLLMTSCNIILRCALGQKYETLGGEIDFDKIGRRLIQQLQEFCFGDFFPSLGWMDHVTRFISRVNMTFRELDGFFDQVIAQHKADPRSPKNDDVKNFLDILLQLQQDDTLDFELTQDSVKALLLDMFLGRSDTGASTLEWGMAELMIHPDKMKKVQEEVRRIVGCKSRIDEDDLNEMKYLKCVIKETLRLHPPAPLLIPRLTSSCVKLGGYDILAKTTVFVNAWAIQRDPKIWERAEEFIPERFGNNEIDFQGQDFKFFSFGIGRRECPGMSFGIALVECVLANLLYWFDWKLPNGVCTSTENLDMSEAQGMTICKKVPLHLQPLPHSFG